MAVYRLGMLWLTVVVSGATAIEIKRFFVVVVVGNHKCTSQTTVLSFDKIIFSIFYMHLSLIKTTDVCAMRKHFFLIRYVCIDVRMPAAPHMCLDYACVAGVSFCLMAYFYRIFCF